MLFSRSLLLGAAFGSIVAVLGCTTPQPPGVPTDTRAADAATVQKLDEDWARAAQTKQVPAWVAFYADDAVVLPPGEGPATTKEAISRAIARLFALRDLTLNWAPSKVEVARSGDLAYVRGTYQDAFRTAKGKRVEEHGKYVEIWRRQPDGSWKCIVDTWNSDLP